MAKKLTDQQDMFGHFDPKTGVMRKIRAERRNAGFTEVALWVPNERKEELREIARKMVKNCPREMPRSKP